MISTEPYSNDGLTIPVVFNKYFQYYPPLLSYESEIRNIFLNGLERERKDVLQAYSVRNPVYIPRVWMLNCYVSKLFPDELITV
jgi:hypothetical protein